MNEISHNVLALIFDTSSPGMSESFRKRSMRIKSNLWQCRRKCSLSSFAIPQEQERLKPVFHYTDFSVHSGAAVVSKTMHAY